MQDKTDTLKEQAKRLASIDLRGMQLSVLELLMTGYCEPLKGYLGQADAISVLEKQRLANGRPWSFPLLLGVSVKVSSSIAVADLVALRDPEGVLLALLAVEEKWMATSLSPEAATKLRLFGYDGEFFLSGTVRRVELPMHYDFAELRLMPEELRQQFGKRGWRKVLACQPGDIIHRAEAARIVHAARVAQANVLVQALATDDETITPLHYTRIRCLEHAMRYLPERSNLLCVMPAVGVTSGREVLWRAALARNAGATHLLVEPEWWNDVDDHRRAEIAAMAREGGIELVILPRFVRDAALGAFLPTPGGVDSPGQGQGTAEVVRRIRDGVELPDWLSFPEVVDELRRSHPVKGRQGVTVFFTGLSGAGKSTIARVLLAKLLEMGERTVTLLDGDIVRKNLSSELGFSREHRDLNIQRIGFVSSEITKHGGIAICAPIAPYRATRRKVRQMVEEHGGFLEIHVATPLETCESRDRKGLYAKARAGLIKEFTGISDPYEAPEHPEIVIDTRDCTPMEAAQMIVMRLESDGFIG